MAISAAQLATATELTKSGRLLEATRAIQAALGFAAPPTETAKGETLAAEDSALRTQDSAEAEDVEYRETILRPAVNDSRAGRADYAPSANSTFRSAHFMFGTDRYRYRLFIPARTGNAQPLPVVVMLHGCKQNSEDFARGTGMNMVADREQAIVVYPEQLRKGNSMGCWNWFEPGHQDRDAGEPAMIAALTQHIAVQHGGDPSRIYVAGLSAGAAMAVLLGELYPEVFAAVGAHSGLPAGAAGDVTSAFAAMRRGASVARNARAVPTIVFHGSGDQTVAPGNADAIVRGQIAAWSSSGTPLAVAVENEIDGARPAKRTVWANAAGEPKLELWRIAGGPHAWSGGDASGSFTDPAGPSASQAMLRFMLLQRRATQHAPR